MKAYFLLCVILVLPAIAAAQGYEQWVIPSKYLGRNDTVAVIRPLGHNTSATTPIVYLLHGYTGSHRQWPKVTDCQKLADQYGCVIICPDAFDTWYINSASDSNSRMEDFFFKELVPKVHHIMKVDSSKIFISGLSMGGYGALYYFLRHQNYFTAAASSSGALTTDYALLKRVWSTNKMLQDIGHAMGPVKRWEQYEIPWLLRHASGTTKPFLMDCGVDDVLLAATKEVEHVADSMKLPVTTIFQPGNHSRAYWAKSILQHFAFFYKQ